MNLVNLEVRSYAGVSGTRTPVGSRKADTVDPKRKNKNMKAKLALLDPVNYHHIQETTRLDQDGKNVLRFWTVTEG